MPLLHITSPHAAGKNSTEKVMQLVLLATLPGIAALTIAFGWGTLSNIIIISTAAVILEAGTLWLLKKPVGFYPKSNLVHI